MVVFLGSVPYCHGDLAIFLCLPSLSVGGGSFLLHTLDGHSLVPNKVLADVQRYVPQIGQGSAGISDRDSDEEAVHGMLAQNFVVFPRGIFDVLSCIRIISRSIDSSACRAVRG